MGSAAIQQESLGRGNLCGCTTPTRTQPSSSPVRVRNPPGWPILGRNTLPASASWMRLPRPWDATSPRVAMTRRRSPRPSSSSRRCSAARWRRSRVLEAEGVAFGGAAGHSLGEFAALVAADVLGLADALDVVVVRGRAMQRAGEERPGTMTALLGVDAEQGAALCDDARGDDVLVVANENSPVQVVISGSIPAIERAETLAKERKIRAVRLNVAGAFHSSLMEPAVAPIVDRLASIAFRPPRFPIAENVTGALVDDPGELRALLGRHVVSPVRWQSCVQALSEAGATTFIEAGPGDVLTKLAKRVVPDADRDRRRLPRSRGGRRRRGHGWRCRFVRRGSTRRRSSRASTSSPSRRRTR